MLVRAAGLAPAPSCGGTCTLPSRFKRPVHLSTCFGPANGGDDGYCPRSLPIDSRVPRFSASSPGTGVVGRVRTGPLRVHGAVSSPAGRRPPWSSRPESNRHPRASDARALPIELRERGPCRKTHLRQGRPLHDHHVSRFQMAPRAGLEPASTGFVGRCPIQLGDRGPLCVYECILPVIHVNKFFLSVGEGSGLEPPRVYVPRYSRPVADPSAVPSIWWPNPESDGRLRAFDAARAPCPPFGRTGGELGTETRRLVRRLLSKQVWAPCPLALPNWCPGRDSNSHYHGGLSGLNGAGLPVSLPGRSGGVPVGRTQSGLADQRVYGALRDCPSVHPGCGVEPGEGLHPLCQAVAKSLISAGVAVSKPTTSRQPASLGSAIVKPVEVMATTTSFAGMPVSRR